MQLPQIVEVKGVRVLTTKQLAEAYQTSTDTIKTNFGANRRRFIEGKHYIAFVGDELKEFKKQVRNPYLVANRASHLYLWTEKGALLHAKSLNTDKAWEVYDYLVDFYFRTKEQATMQQATPKAKGKIVVDVPENRNIQEAIAKIQDDLICTKVLLSHCNRYMSRDKYKELCNVAGDSVRNIQADFSRLCFIEPNEVEKIL